MSKTWKYDDGGSHKSRRPKAETLDSFDELKELLSETTKEVLKVVDEAVLAEPLGQGEEIMNSQKEPVRTRPTDQSSQSDYQTSQNPTRPGSDDFQEQRVERQGGRRAEDATMPTIVIRQEGDQVSATTNVPIPTEYMDKATAIAITIMQEQQEKSSNQSKISKLNVQLKEIEVANAESARSSHKAALLRDVAATAAAIVGTIGGLVAIWKGIHSLTSEANQPQQYPPRGR